MIPHTREAYEAAGRIWVDPAPDEWDPVESMTDEEYDAELERQLDALRRE